MNKRSYLFITKLIVPCEARLRSTSLASTAIPSGCIYTSKIDLIKGIEKDSTFKPLILQLDVVDYLFWEPNSWLCASLKDCKSKCSGGSSNGSETHKYTLFIYHLHILDSVLSNLMHLVLKNCMYQKSETFDTPRKFKAYTDSLLWLNMPTVLRPLEQSKSTCPAVNTE